LSPAVLALLVACAEAAPPLAGATDSVLLEGVEAVLPVGGDVRSDAAPTVSAGGPQADTTEAVPPLEVTAARSTWDLQRGVLTLTGDVVATRGPMRLVCGSAEVRLGEHGRVSTVEARQDVVLTDRGRIGRAQEAQLDARLGRVVLTRDASLAEPPHLMRGEPIVIFLDEERVECASCELRIDGDGSGRGQ